jgi:hypothetical protein
MKNQNKPGDQPGNPKQQNESPTGKQNQGNQNRSGDMRNEQRSGKEENEGQSNREGQETNRDITSRTNSDVKNTDRGRIPGDESGGEDVSNESEMENLEDEDEARDR